MGEPAAICARQLRLKLSPYNGMRHTVQSVVISVLQSAAWKKDAKRKVEGGEGGAQTNDEETPGGEGHYKLVDSSADAARAAPNGRRQRRRRRRLRRSSDAGGGGAGGEIAVGIEAIQLEGPLAPLDEELDVEFEVTEEEEEEEEETVNTANFADAFEGYEAPEVSW